MTSKEALIYVKMCCSDGLQLPQNQSLEQVKLIGASIETIEKDLEVLEILKKYIYYSVKSHCIRMREIRKSIYNFDYEDLKGWLKERLENEENE